MNSAELAEHAVNIKHSGKNCAQAVAMALAEETGLTEEQMRVITAGFGLGMGTMEGTCGALAGACVVAGLKTKGEGTSALTRQMSKVFHEKCGAVICKELKGVKTGTVLCPCDDCVRNAVRAYAEVTGNV